MTLRNETSHLLYDDHDDELVYQKATRGFFEANVPEAPKEELELIEKYVTKRLARDRRELGTVTRFTLASPSMNAGFQGQSGMKCKAASRSESFSVPII